MRVQERYGKLPLRFEVNQGQADARVKFSSHGSGYDLFLTPKETVLVLAEPAARKPSKKAPPKPASPTQQTSPSRQRKDFSVSKKSVLRLKLLDANPQPNIVGLDELPGKSNFFLGNEPQRWFTEVPNYARVKYEEVYPGIDVIYYGNQRTLEYDFVVAPGADPRAIRLTFEGGEQPRLDRNGDLLLSIDNQTLKQHRPVVYQEISGKRKEVPSRYVLIGKREVKIEVGAYDTSKPLIIDPVISFSTFLHDVAYGVAVDANGSAYVVGLSSGSLTVVNPLQASYGGNNEVYIQKLSPAGDTILYSTYLGGSGDDALNEPSIALDASGQIYVTGTTNSTNFPTLNPFQANNGGDASDLFVTKIGASGNYLVYSTYLGGSDNDVAGGLAVDLSGKAYLTGATYSTNFPTLNPLQSPACSATSADAFISVLNVAGDGLVYSTHLGGSNSDFADAIAVDTTSNAYVTGNTYSIDFPTVNAFQATFNDFFGYTDAFVTKVNATGSALLYSTYLGGADLDQGLGIAVDTSGYAYVTGHTYSTNFPTVNPYQANLVLDAEVFVTKLGLTGSTLVYSTYLGGDSTDIAGGIAVDVSGNVYVTGETRSIHGGSYPGFPVKNPLQSNLASVTPGPYYYDAFLAKLNAAGSDLIFSTYLGGKGEEYAFAVAVDSSGSAYIVGYSEAQAFPLVNAPQQIGPGGFITKFSGLNLFTISGLVKDNTGAGIAAVTVTLSGSQNLSVQTNGSGNYSIPNLPENGNYTVTPTKAGFTFMPLSQTFNNLTADQTANFSTLSYSISGKVTTASVGVAGITVTLSGAQTGTATTDANGNYTFSNLVPGGNYIITPSKLDYLLTYTFTPASRTYNNLSANQTTADFSFTTATNVTLYPIADAYVQDGSGANTNYGAVTPLNLRTDSVANSGNNRDVYFKFDLGPVTKNITSVKLRFYAALSATGSVNTSAYSVSNITWIESGTGSITWNTKPTLSGSPLSGASATINSTSYTTYEVDVTNYVRGEKLAGRDLVSLALHNPSASTQNITLNAREAASNRPLLFIQTSDFTNAAPAVTLTAPANGASYNAPASISAAMR
jgi:hypothetical protein